MKQGTSLTTRCLALVMALVLLVSNANLGLAHKVFAGETDKIIVTEGEIVAGGYALSNAEKELIGSGLLVGGSQEFSKPTDGDNLISVDNAAKTVTVANYEDSVSGKTWTPVSVKLVYEGGEEVLTLNAGKATYTYAGAAFSVEAEYEVKTAVDTAVQTEMLRAAAYLKDGKRELDTIKNNRGNLSAYQQANDYLVQLADGISLGVMGTLQFKSQAAIDSAKFLGTQIDANGDKLELVTMANTYAAPYSKYLVESGIALEAKAVETYEHINNVFSDELFTLLSNPESTLAVGLKNYDEAMYNAIMDLFVPSTETWLFNMETVVAEGSWPYGQTASFVKEGADYSALDTLVAKLGTPTTVTPVETLVAATAAVKLNMSMSNVVVKVQWKTVNENNQLALHDEVEAEAITLPDGTAKADILAKIQAADAEGKAAAAWAAEFAEFATHYKPTYSELPETLSGAVTYVITYAPVEYKVTGGAVDGSHPYGYTVTLPKHDQSPAKVYDYTVDGTYMAEGEKVVILGNTVITRAEGSARENTTLLEEVLKDSAVTADENTILNSDAVTAGTDAISIRFPSDSKVTLNEATGVVTAQKVLSDYPGKTLYWIPTTAMVAIGETTKEYTMTEGENGYTATITENNYDSVTVHYTLTIADLDAGALKNLPYALVTESKDQLNRMGQLVAEMGSLESVPYDVMEMLKKYATGETLTKLENMLAKCYTIDVTKLDLYHYLKAYAAKTTDAEKLVYYYQNQATMDAQLAILVDALKVINEDAAFKATCIEKLGPQATDAFEKVAAAEDKLDKIYLPKVNAAVNVKSAALLTLAEKLVASTTKVNSHASAPLVMVHTITKAASGKVTVTVNLTQGANKASFNMTVNIGQKLNADAFNAKYAEAFASMNIAAADEKYYTDNSGAVAAILAAACTENKTHELVWTANEYEVVVDEVNYGKITINNTSVTLPAHETEGMIYEYTVNGTAYEQGDAVNVWDSFHNKTLAISRVEVNQKAEQEKTRYEEFKDVMGKVSAENEALDLVFSNEDTMLTMELAVDADQSVIMNSVVAFVEALTGQPYNIYLNDGPLYIGGEVSLQTMINAMLSDSNFNNDGVVNALRNDQPLMTGEMKLVGKAKSIEAEKVLTFAIKKTGTRSQLDSAANAIEAIKPYVSFQSNNDKLDVKLNLPEKVYEIYLTALLGIGEVDLSDVNAVNTAIATMFVYDYMEGILADDAITTTTWQNTLKILDETAQDKLPNYDLTQYERRYQQMRTVFNKYAVVSETAGENAYPVVALNIPAKKAIDTVVSKINKDIPSGFLDQIMEYNQDGNLVADIHVTIANTNKDFEAIVADLEAVKAGVKELQSGVTKDKLVDLVKGKGLANGVDYTSDLAKRLAETKGAAVVLLLDDVNSDLVFNGTTVLDLNGKTINSNIQSNGHLYIFDSVLGNAQGGVTGTISGNVTITAGKYEKNVTAFLPEGYKYENNLVVNELYTIVNENGNLTFQINSDVIDTDIDSYKSFAKALAAEMALDIVMNSYPYAMLTANGHEIYGFTYDDYMGLLASANTAGDAVDVALDCISLPGMADFINDVMADLLDFAALETALSNEDVVASYSVATAPWTLVIRHNTEYDCITGGLVADKAEQTTRTLSLKFVGNNTVAVASFFGFLANDIKAEAEIKLVDVENLTFDNKHFNVVGGVKGKLSADLSDYTTYLAILVANALDADAKTAMVNAVNAGDDVALKAAFDAITVKNVADALKILNRGDDFATLAKNVGIKADIDLTAKQALLEKAMMWTLSAAGRALEELEITGNGKTLGGLDKDGDGVYDFAKAYSKSGDITKRGYGVNYNVTTVSADVSVILFEIEDCLWGDANHDGVVDGKDVTLYRWMALKNTYPEIETPISLDGFCQIRTDFNADGTIDGKDITYERWLALKYTYPEIETPINLDEFYVEQ